MFNISYCYKNKLYTCIVIITIFTILPLFNAFAHGGRNHDTNAFTSLKAVQKALGMYDKLIAGGNLPEDWESGLKNIQVTIREKNGKSEYVVSFQKTEGNPAAVYFFFTLEGRYAGSNFTGQ